MNTALAGSYLQALQQLEKQFGLRYDVTVSTLARYPDILTVQQAAVDEDAVWQAVQQVTDQALDRFIAMREREGERLPGGCAFAC